GGEPPAARARAHAAAPPRDVDDEGGAAVHERERPGIAVRAEPAVGLDEQTPPPRAANRRLVEQNAEGVLQNGGHQLLLGLGSQGREVLERKNGVGPEFPGGAKFLASPGVVVSGMRRDRHGDPESASALPPTRSALLATRPRDRAVLGR